MATYRIKAPDGSEWDINAPDTASEAEVMSYAQSQWKPKAAQPSRRAERAAKNREELIDLAQGAASGIADVGDTLLNVATFLPGKAIPAIKRWNDARSASLDAFNKENDSAAFSAGRIGTNIAATLPVGGVLSKLLAKSPKLAPLAEAIRTGGFNAGGAGVATRMAGGGITGAASTALVSPDDADTGAVVGAALPPALKLAGAATGGAARLVRGVTTPTEVNLAGTIVDVSGMSPQQVKQLITAQGPSMIPGSAPTVPQILQTPGTSQLQRTVKAAGGSALLEREMANNAARLAALDRISPVSSTVQQAAENFGNVTQDFAIPANRAEAQRVSQLYDGVDPFTETKLLLPIKEMAAARDKFLGPGTFGSGARADEAIRTAERIGTKAAPKPRPETGLGSSLLQDVRDLGGVRLDEIRDITGESRAGKGRALPPALFTKSGRTLDDLATELRERGYHIPDDVDGGAQTVRDLIRQELDGDKVYPMQEWDKLAARAEAEASPVAVEQAAKRVPAVVPFREVQNLRSSLGEAAQEALAKGRNKEAAALSKMIDEIDSRVNAVADGRGAPEEAFPADIVNQWRKANAAHAARKQRFETGPQAAMFRAGGDGQPSAQGAELAGKFFNPTRSQVEDARAFNRLAGDNRNLIDARKNYITTDFANQTDQFGNLTNAKVRNWLNARSGALRESLDDPENALLNYIGKEVEAASLAENLGRASGSDTVQKAQAALRLGLLDDPFVKAIASRVPFAGPTFETLREAGKRSKANALSELLADPALLDMALDRYLKSGERGRLAALVSDRLAPNLYRGVPLLSIDR